MKKFYLGKKDSRVLSQKKKILTLKIFDKIAGILQFCRKFSIFGVFFSAKLRNFAENFRRKKKEKLQKCTFFSPFLIKMYLLSCGSSFCPRESTSSTPFFRQNCCNFVENFECQNFFFSLRKHPNVFVSRLGQIWLG